MFCLVNLSNKIQYSSQILVLISGFQPAYNKDFVSLKFGPIVNSAMNISLNNFKIIRYCLKLKGNLFFPQ